MQIMTDRLMLLMLPLRNKPLVTKLICSFRAIARCWSYWSSIVIWGTVTGSWSFVVGGLGSFVAFRSFITTWSWGFVIRSSVAGLWMVGGFFIGAWVAVRVNFGAVTNLFANFLWDILDNYSGDGVTNFFGNLDAVFFGNLLLNIHWVLSTDGFRKLFALFSRNVDWKILTSFVWNFLTFCSRNWFLHFLWNLLAVLFGYLEI